MKDKLLQDCVEVMKKRGLINYYNTDRQITIKFYAGINERTFYSSLSKEYNRILEKYQDFLVDADMVHYEASSIIIWLFNF